MHHLRGRRLKTSNEYIMLRPSYHGGILFWMTSLIIASIFTAAFVAAFPQSNSRRDYSCSTSSQHRPISIGFSSEPTSVVLFANKNSHDNSEEDWEISDLAATNPCKLLSWHDKYHNLPESVHIILFSAGTPFQGAHTIGSPGTVGCVLFAFADKDACDRVASALKAQQFFDPTTHEVSSTDLLDWSHDKGDLFVQVVPAGMDVLNSSQKKTKRNLVHGRFQTDGGDGTSPFPQPLTGVDSKKQNSHEDPVFAKAPGKNEGVSPAKVIMVEADFALDGVVVNEGSWE